MEVAIIILWIGRGAPGFLVESSECVVSEQRQRQVGVCLFCDAVVVVLRGANKKARYDSIRKKAGGGQAVVQVTFLLGYFSDS